MKKILFYCLVWLCFHGVNIPVAHAQLSEGLISAIEERRWPLALSAAPRDSLAFHYVSWRYLLEQEELSFATIEEFVRRHPDWPNLNQLQVKAEKYLFKQRVSSDTAARWLKDYPPISGYGKLALLRLGMGGDKAALVRDAWINGDFERADEAIIREEFGQYLDEASHRLRTNRLLKEEKATIAERMLGIVGSDYAMLYRARMALIRNEPNPNRHIDAVPSNLRGNDGLMADRALWRNRKGLERDTFDLVRGMHPDSEYADMLWRIRSSLIRDTIEARRYDEAMHLLNGAGSKLTSANLADALWMKGWVELNFRNKPDTAYPHFTRLYESVQFPVSRSRGAYWAARAAEAMGKSDDANHWYQQASRYASTFYGQLAQSHLWPNQPLKLDAPFGADAAVIERFRSKEPVQIALLLMKAGLTAQARPFIVHVADQLSSPADYAALMAVFTQQNLTHAQVLVSKSAMRLNILLPDGWPRPPAPREAALEIGLAYAISRQESEFNPIAVSHADARGLMQLLPTTAQKVTQKMGKPYQLSMLFEPAYNVAVGSRYISDLIDGFDGSYILAIAGYNAGPGRSREWTDRFGNPGSDLGRTLNWLESIPFGETRNYVQRVLENLQVYRALEQPNRPLEIEKDLLR